MKTPESRSGSIPVTTYTQYREFKKTGDREPYQVPLFRETADCLPEAVDGSVAERGGRSLDRVNDLVWNICEETNWVIPATRRWARSTCLPRRRPPTWRWPSFCSVRVCRRRSERGFASEVRRRVIDPYLDHGQRFWWNNGGNNWTGVCAGSVGQTLLILEPDPSGRPRASPWSSISSIASSTKAFEEDGASTEGIGYWNYGLSHFVIFAEMLRARTGGAIDLLAGEKIRKIAAYPAAIAIGRHAFASFSDSREDGSVLAVPRGEAGGTHRPQAICLPRPATTA